MVDVYKDWLGIPDGPRPPDHYQLLRLVRFEDNTEKTRSNYRKLNAHVRKYSTGQYASLSQDLLNELAKAMLCLTDVDRKREYDESLGREAAVEVDEFGRLPLEKILSADGKITAAQAKEVEKFAEARGLSMRDAVVQMKLVDAASAQQALAQQLGLSYVDLAEMIPDDSVLDKVPRNVVKRHSILPLFMDDGVLLVACTDQPEHELEEELRLRFGAPMRPVIATPLAINQGIAKYYAPGMRDEAAADAAAPKGGKAKKQKPKPARKGGKQDAAARHEQKLVTLIIVLWVTIGSSLFDWYVIKGLIFTQSNWPFYLTLFVAPAAMWYLYQTLAR